MTRRIMRAFKMNEISAVDRPAQAHARMVLMKRAEPDTVKDNLIGVLPNETRALMAKLGDAPKGENEMTEAEIKKAIDDAVAKASVDLTATLETLKRENAVLKMSAKHGAYYADLSDQEKEDFLAMSEAERDKMIAKDPDKQENMPPKAKKALDEAIAKNAANEVVLKQLMEEREIAAFAKRAVGLGLQEEHGEVLRKAYAGDTASVTKLESLIKGLAEQVRTGIVFKEFGSNQSGQGATAKDEMDLKAEEYRKSQVAAGKKCSEAQAFAHVYTEPAHADLKKRYDAEDQAKRVKAA